MLARYWIASAVATATLVLSSCETPMPPTGSDGGEAGQARLLWSESQCGIERSGARFVADRKDLDTIAARASSRQIGDDPAPIEGVDFSRHRVVLVSRGRKPTPGYGIDLDESPLRVDDERATLTLRLAEPDPKDVQAQMLTTPCALIALPRRGYQELRLLNQEGAEWAVLRIVE